MKVRGVLDRRGRTPVKPSPPRSPAALASNHMPGSRVIPHSKCSSLLVGCDHHSTWKAGLILLCVNHIIMNTLEIEGTWNIIRGKLKLRWAQLTDDDLQLAAGIQEDLIGRIQKRTGESRETVEKAIKHASASCCCD